MTDFRALCAELADELDAETGYTKNDGERIVHPTVALARIALTQPEPEGLTLEELNDLCADHGFAFDDNNGEGLSILSDIVNAALARWGRPAIKPEGPTDEELLAIAAASIGPYEDSGIAIGEYEPETERAVHVYGSELIAYGRAVFARWGLPAAEPEGTIAEPRGCPTPGACSCPTAPYVPPELIRALELAEAALADIGDAERESGDDLAWAEARATQDLPRIRTVLARWGK